MRLTKTNIDNRNLKTDLYSIIEAVVEELDSKEKQIAPYIIDRIINKETIGTKRFSSLPDM